MKLCSDVPIINCVDIWSFVTVFVLSLKEIFYLFWCRLSILTESTVTAYSIIFMCIYSYFSTYWIHWNYWYVWNFFSRLSFEATLYPIFFFFLLSQEVFLSSKLCNFFGFQLIQGCPKLFQVVSSCPNSSQLVPTKQYLSTKVNSSI